jgi:methanogenic corrinoid protein MtbC1
MSSVATIKKSKFWVRTFRLTEAFAKEIGSDAFAPDASRAVSLAKSLLEV